MLIDTKNIGKLVEECSEIMNELAKEEIDKTISLKFKSQLKDIQTEYAQVKKLFKGTCKNMQLFESSGSSTTNKESSLRNRKNKM